MFRNDDPTASPTLPTPGAPGSPGYYDDGTIVTPDAINAIQEELCNAVTFFGLALNKAQLNQLAQGLALLAPLVSPLFSGNPRGPTAAQGDSSSSLANTAFVWNALFGQTSLTGPHTFGLTDIGQTFFLPFSTGAETWTIPADADVAIPPGSRIYGVVGMSNVLTLAINSDSLYYPQGNEGGAGIARTLTPPSGSPIRFTLHKYSTTGWILDAPVGVT